MEAITIYPENIASYEWGDDWIAFCMLFGYTDNNIPNHITLTEIKIKNS